MWVVVVVVLSRRGRRSGIIYIYIYGNAFLFGARALLYSIMRLAERALGKAVIFSLEFADSWIVLGMHGQQMSLRYCLWLNYYLGSLRREREKNVGMTKMYTCCDVIVAILKLVASTVYVIGYF